MKKKEETCSVAAASQMLFYRSHTKKNVTDGDSLRLFAVVVGKKISLFGRIFIKLCYVVVVVVMIFSLIL